MPIGELTTIQRQSYFQAAPERLGNPVPLDPRSDPVPEPIIVQRGARTTPLLGMLGDAIPEGWGLKVLHARARRLGREPASLSPEELLCMVGSRGPGALVFSPAIDESVGTDATDLEALFLESMALHRGEATEVAAALGRAAGGSGGARPKVSIDLLPDGTAHAHRGGDNTVAPTWLVKFPSDEDGHDFGSVELAYATMAQAAGLAMPRTRAFDLRGGSTRCFGVERFDRPTLGRRPHVLSLAGLLRADYRTDLTTYETYLQLTYQLAPTLDQLLEAYRRMVFNVLASVRDDHMKNFAFLLPHDGIWGLAPAFDLVPLLGREHATTVAGKALAITQRDLRAALATIMRVPTTTLDQVEQRVLDSVSTWSTAAKEWGVGPRRVTEVQRALDGARRDFGSDGAGADTA